MQTDHLEEKKISVKEKTDTSQIPFSTKKHHYYSATSVSSCNDTLKKHSDSKNNIIDLDQIQFISDFITAKHDALEPVMTESSNSSSHRQRKASIRKWYLLLNVVLPIVQLRKIKTHYISAKTIEYLDVQSKKNSQFKDKRVKEASEKKSNSLEYIQSQIKLFDHIENGLISSINEIQRLINDNAKLINDYNYNRITPLYAACINGHKSIVEFFLNNNADYLLLCNDESVLDAAIRFSYVDIVKVLLHKCAWPKDYISKSRKIATQCHKKVIKELLQNWKKKKESNIFKNCFCFS